MLKISLSSVRSGYDGKTCYVHGRVGVYPDGEAVLTLQKLTVSGCDTFSPVELMTFDGQNWSEPRPDPAFSPVFGADTVALACDMTPAYHTASGRMLCTGHTAVYRKDVFKLAKNRRRATSFAVYNRESRCFSPWKALELPDDALFYCAGAGCTQRSDLPDGTILLPHYCRAKQDTAYCSLTFRCSFDGERLRYLGHGAPVIGETGERGLYEPSLIYYDGLFYLTLRSDRTGFVAVSQDGLTFTEPREWCFNDGKSVGNYHTQQHFFTLGGKLWLVYTRCGVNNDHVFRHRAPLLTAEVDPERLVLLRDTEQILIPERGARLGNFGVTQVSGSEVLVSACEWMQPAGCEQYGSDNTLWLARIGIK